MDDVPSDGIIMLEPTHEDLWGAVHRFELPLALMSLSDSTIIAANDALLQRVGKSSAQVVGHPGPNLFTGTDRENAHLAVTAMQRGAVDFYTAQRVLTSSITPQLLVSVWVRAIEFGDRRFALVEISARDDSLVNPLVEHFGFAPLEMAVGLIDPDGTVSSISCDITDMLDIPSEEILGQPFGRTAEHQSIYELIDLGRREHYAVSMPVRLKDGHGEVKNFCCIVTSLADSPSLAFILIPISESLTPDNSNRAAQLEQHLMRIANEIQASGVVKNLNGLAVPTQYQLMDTLTTRQWEVLSRLLRGQRVPSIAESLFVSPSTVRNTLSSIFKKFGVSSQSELLELLTKVDNSSL
ncbi:MAG TPA: helix-turn-helix transcriptional regulator [Acidimicrobiales bacterium]